MQQPISQTNTTYYEIVVKGHLDQRWSRKLNGFTITLLPHDQTLLAGTVADQPALHGMLARIRDLGLDLISVVQRANQV
jgi:hypothetical protein